MYLLSVFFSQYTDLNANQVCLECTDVVLLELSGRFLMNHSFMIDFDFWIGYAKMGESLYRSVINIKSNTDDLYGILSLSRKVASLKAISPCYTKIMLPTFAISGARVNHGQLERNRSEHPN